MFSGVVMLICAFALIVGPWFIPGDVPSIVKMISMVVGALLGVIGGVIIVITRLYVKAPANIAYVRTGLGGARVIRDSGCIVIPVVHQLVTVSLHTFPMQVERFGHDALICGDKLRADVRAEFFVHVPPEDEKVKCAARSLGGKSDNEGMMEQTVNKLLEPKLVNALRSVAATMPFEHLLTERELFAKNVLDSVKSDIEINGFILESVTISSLDQTPIDTLRTDNVVDAQGRQKAAQIISENQVKENTFKKTAEQQIAEQNAFTTEAVTAQQLKAATAEATRDANIAKAQSAQKREAAVFAAEQDRETQQAQILAQQQIGQTEAEKQKQIQVANIEAQKAAGTAQVEQQKAIEVAKRQQDMAVAQAEKERAAVETEKLKTEQEREREKQGVQTVLEVAAADRAKQVKVIDAQQAAEVQKTQQNNQADIAAYQTVKQATAAEEAASRNANAIKTEADANKQAKVLEAEGQTAIAMVPVNVKQREVEVDAKRQLEVETARVNVLTQELEAKVKNEQISVELETRKLVVAAIQAVGVANAEAMGKALAAANMNVYGSADMLKGVMDRFGQGASFQSFANGLLSGDEDNPIASLISGLGGASGLGGLAGLLTSKLGANKEAKSTEPPAASTEPAETPPAEAEKKPKK